MSIQPLQTWWRSPNFLFGTLIPSGCATLTCWWFAGLAGVLISDNLHLIHYPEFLPVWVVTASNVVLIGVPTLLLVCLGYFAGGKVYDSLKQELKEGKS